MCGVVAVVLLAASACSGSGGEPAAPAAARIPPPNDPLFPQQWHLQAIGIPDAWSVTDGAGATVAVLDTGVAHEDRAPYRRAPDLSLTRFVPGWDFVDDDAYPDDEPVPGRPGHGTHMTGTIAQTTGNALGGAGVAPGVAVMPVRVLSPDGSGTDSDIAEGLRFAVDHGADVANLSLGNVEATPEVADAVRYALDKGVTVVAPIGEEGLSSATYPAEYPGVIAVGAVRFDKTLASYSNRGPRLDLVAPGGERASDQNGDGLEDGIVQQSVYEHHDSFCFCFIEGTSSAAAHVSGVAALLVAAGLRGPAVRETLLATAQDLGPPGRDDTYGAGLVDAAAAVRQAKKP